MNLRKIPCDNFLTAHTMLEAGCFGRLRAPMWPARSVKTSVRNKTIAGERSCMKKEMLINVLQPEESRIAIVEDGILEELYVERVSQESYVGNIYKGRVVNLEPAIQAAFVDFGVGRNGFLHVSDVEYQYYKHLLGKEE